MYFYLMHIGHVGVAGIENMDDASESSSCVDGVGPNSEEEQRNEIDDEIIKCTRCSERDAVVECRTCSPDCEGLCQSSPLLHK